MWLDDVAADLLGMSKDGESSRMAVETTIHPISYTTHEGEPSYLERAL